MVASILASLAAIAVVYWASTYFLQFLLPGYPKVDWLCRGSCTWGAVAALAAPFTAVTVGLAGVGVGLARLDGPERARTVLGLATVNPGLVLCLVSPAWSLLPLASALVVLTRLYPSRVFEALVASLLAAMLPWPLAVALVVMLACWKARWGVLHVLGAAVLGVVVRQVWPSVAWVDPVAMPGVKEAHGVALVGWAVVGVLVVAASTALLHEQRRGVGLAALACVLVALAAGSAAPLRFVAALPLVWWVDLPRVLRGPLMATFAALQGVFIYHLAHQVPVL